LLHLQLSAAQKRHRFTTNIHAHVTKPSYMLDNPAPYGIYVAMPEMSQTNNKRIPGDNFGETYRTAKPRGIIPDAQTKRESVYVPIL
jgi:hypothetical protein